MLNQEEAENIKEQLLEQIENLSIDEERKARIKNHIQNSNSEELENFIKQMQASELSEKLDGECLFCKITKNEVKTIRVYEDKDIIVVMDIMPASQGHLILFPKEHYHFIQEIPDLLLNKLFYFVKKISPVLIEVLKAEAISIYVPQGALAGQRTPHFLINIIPRYKNDKLNFDWSRQKKEIKELESLAEKIRKKAEQEIRKCIDVEKEKQEKKKKKEQESEAEKIYRHVKRKMP